MSKWINVEEKMPEEKTMVILVAINSGPRGNYTTDMYCGWQSRGDWARWPHDFRPTHWMQLPDPPKE